MAEELTQDQKWKAIYRGQIINGAVNKYVSIIQLVDQKAQAMIILNSILVPVCIKGFDDPILHYPALISILTACVSILASIVCIYPKRSHRKLKDDNFNYLHFNDIGHVERDEFLAAFMPIFNDTSCLAEIAVRDLHDTARKSIIPKYFWIKISYGTFFIGNLAAIAVMGYLL